jgi:anti-sigma B factor antagonist
LRTISKGSIEIGEERRGEAIVLRPVGRIDNDTSPSFQARLLAAIGAMPNTVVVDLGGVEYISSAGLRALMMGAKQAKAAKGHLAVAGLKPVVKEIFTISRFGHVVQVFETPDDALAAWR